MLQTASRFAATYIFERFFVRIVEFLRRWYIGAGLAFAHLVIHRLSILDRTFALKITLLHFFTPLYGDESFIGRILGIIFRSVRAVFAIIIYLVIGIFALLLYIIWALIPIYFLAKIVGI